MSSPVIEFDGVDFAFDGGPPVLEDVRFAIGNRELVSIVGPNGGGKTTLLKLVTGMLQPSSGTVRIFGEKPEVARPRIGYMPQYIHADLDFPISVMDVALMGCIGGSGLRGFLGWPSGADRKRAMDALYTVGMTPLAKRRFSDLSGGQRQRVMIARALACHPELLLLDEPTANVDNETETRFMELLKELARDITVVIVSHDMGFVSSVVQNVLCVNRKVVFHPVSQLTGASIRDLYNETMHLVRHDHIHAKGV